MSLIKELIGKLTDCKDTIKQKFDIVKDKVGHTFEVVKDKVGQVFESCKSSAKCTVATGLIAAMMFASLASCANNIEIIDTDNVPSYGDTVIDTYYTDHITDTQLGYETESTDSNNSNNSNVDDFDRFEHSDAYNQAKQEWGSDFHKRFGMTTEMGFLSKPAPFSFLEQEGLVYYNEDGEPRAYGTDDNFENYQCIQSNGWIDPSTPENDYYHLTQYISGSIDDNNPNGDTYVATYMLKYTVDDLTYRDIIANSGNACLGRIIIKMDKNITDGKSTNTREVISKSAIKYDLVDTLDLFKDLPNGGINQPLLDRETSNWVENIDYTNMRMTVNYTSKNTGDIYSYTYKLKETKNWNDILLGDKYTEPVPQEKRDSLTHEQTMPTYSSNAGNVLSNAHVFGWKLAPSTEQKATASLKHDNWLQVQLNSGAGNEKIQDYEAGKISFAEINDLTRDYVENLKSGLVQ